MKKLFFLTLITTLSTSFIFACSIMPSKCYELYPNRDTHEFRTCVDNERMQQIQIRRASLEKKLKEHEQEYNEIKNKLYVYTRMSFGLCNTLSTFQNVMNIILEKNN
jgi:septal ring factor EnvC (AmiA/AmiB activator)